MKRVILMAQIVLVSLIGATAVSRAGGDGIPQQLQRLTNMVTTIQDTVSNINQTVQSGVTCTPRRYYLSNAAVNGSGALSACAAGFHMASLFEILDPTQLKYDTDPGRAFHPPDTDQGAGPPTSIAGWVRTGSLSAGTGGPGGANCFSYSSSSSSDTGTAVFLGAGWAFALTYQSPTQLFNVTSWWETLELPCSGILTGQDQISTRVWCVEDSP